MKRTWIVLFMGLVVLAGCRTDGPATRPTEATGLPVQTMLPVEQLLTPRPAPGDEIPRISAEELYLRRQAGETIIVADARDADSYRAQHIAGAISVPATEVAQHLSELPRDKLIVFYCT